MCFDIKTAVHLFSIRVTNLYILTNLFKLVSTTLLLPLLYFHAIGFQLSNWQKVQFNTDLFLDTQKYFFTGNGLIKSIVNSWLKKGKGAKLKVQWPVL